MVFIPNKENPNEDFILHLKTKKEYLKFAIWNKKAVLIFQHINPIVPG